MYYINVKKAFKSVTLARAELIERNSVDKPAGLVPLLLLVVVIEVLIEVVMFCPACAVSVVGATVVVIVYITVDSVLFVSALF